MKLFISERAPNVVRVEIFLKEKNINVKTEVLDIMKGEAQTPTFTALNPMKRVPVLELDNGTLISESVAICRYFEALQPEPLLMGSSAEEQAVIEMWNRRAELNLLLAIASVFRHSHPAMAKLEVPQIKDWSEANRPRALEAMEVFDAQLAKNEFVAGDKFSIADITTYVAMIFTRPAKVEVPESLSNLHRWLGEVKQRPSIAS
ncbi:glutathione S-transferase [Pseudovibrio exalbescens]|uniref:glutathione S-transferase n=1 Tax=Pseudovibrio exalbescens TaxID=197461 RepID=UPI00236732EF|nr:glutathione S-transferase [Pseudovibrio exalbescens]MDD7909062.1 glutathione S-transferase [Pseudovibrio exalbescens]